MGTCLCDKPIKSNSCSILEISPINNIISYNNNNNLIDDIKNLKKLYKNTKVKSKIYFDDIKEQETCISNYKTFISEFHYQINNLKDNLNISAFGEKYYNNLLTEVENKELLNDIEIISYQITEFNDLLENQKMLLKNLENIFRTTQELFNEININTQSKEDFWLLKYAFIQKQLKIETIIENMEHNKTLYEKKNSDIKKDIYNIQLKTKKKYRQ